MAVFPVSPTVGQEETVLGRTFVYDGYGWVVKVSGGHTILDPAGDTMPTQDALQFGEGFTVTDDTGKTVVGGGSFSESIPFVNGSMTFDKNKYIQSHQVTNTFQFTKSAGTHYAGAIIEACFVADGVTGHKPTFSTDFNVQYDNWDNTNGAKNLVRMRYLPEGILTEIRKI